MSWLLVALIPGWLMLAAFGLDRLEMLILAERVPRPAASPRLTAAPPRETIDGLKQRLLERRITVDAAISRADAARLPTRLQTPRRTNTEFPATRHPNRV